VNAKTVEKIIHDIESNLAQIEFAYYCAGDLKPQERVELEGIFATAIQRIRASNRILEEIAEGEANA
jgi:hypothetical protein